MKLISVKPSISADKCIGCGICSKVCPAATIAIKDKKAIVDEEFCRGCGACEQRCPVYAIAMVKLEKPYTVAVNVEDVPYEKIKELCKTAHMHPEQIICYCTATRAEEVAAAVLTGAKTPEEISRRTGIRMGCKVECIQPILRILKAAGIDPERPDGYQWYGITPTLWDISPEIKEKYKTSGFYFDEDIKILEKVIKAKGSRGIVDAQTDYTDSGKISQYGIHPDLLTKRMAEYPEMTSVMVKELFPDAPEVIYPSAAGDGLDLIKKAAIAALQNVDMSMIKPGHSVNVLASHHGFTLLGGQPYATFLKVVRDEIESKTGATDIRLRAGNGLRFRETEEYIKQYGLNVHFKGKARCIAPIDEGIPIKTEIGTLYGLKSVYDADWIVHAHNSDVREVHFHRHVDRAVKPFGMSYARIETRSTYHQNLGPRGANFTARSIFESEFVKSKFAFTAFLDMAPSGVVGVVAANDLFELNDYLTFVGLNYYGKIMTLLGEIDECIVGLDFPCPVPYVFAAGVIYANMVGANVDLFDLDGDLPPYTWYTEAFYGKNGKPLIDDIAPVNPAVKMVIHNYAWGGYPSAFFSEQIPTIVVKKEQAELFDNDPQNLEYTKHAVISESLDNAMQFAYKTANTDKVLIFDGAIGGLNLSHSLLQLLQAKAPAVSKRVDEELMPKWLRQRGISPLGLSGNNRRLTLGNQPTFNIGSMLFLSRH